MKVLVVGGAGYIGSHAVMELIRAGHEVIIYDNLSTGYEMLLHPQARFYLGDILDAKQLDTMLSHEQARGPIDVLINFAAKLIVPESLEQPLEYFHNNTEGVRTLLEAMCKHGIKHIVFSSTAAVYGQGSKEPCHEDMPLDPINPYGASKRACEDIIKWVSKRYDITYCIFRYFNVAGADSSLKIGLYHDQITHLIPVIMQTALGIREKFVVYGDDYKTFDGSCVRDYIHVSDLARAHVMGAEYLVSGKPSLIANLGSGTGYSVKEVLNEALKICDISYEYGPRRPGDPDILIADTQRAKNILGFSPKLDLHDMLASDLAFRKQLCKKQM